MVNRLGPDSISKIVRAKSYREFMQILIEESSRSGKKLSFADIARRAGFKSRSFPRDVMLGNKRITLHSMYPMIRGLNLTGDLSSYFRLLVETEHEDCRLRVESPTKTASRMMNIRARLDQKNHVVIDTADNLFSSNLLPFIYAALGDSNKGATAQEVQRLTELNTSEVVEGLRALLERGFISKQGENFSANKSHFSLQRLGGRKTFRDFWNYCNRRSVESAEESFDNNNKLFFASCFSVRKKSLPLLREELRGVLLKYVDQAEDMTGNKISTLVCSLT